MSGEGFFSRWARRKEAVREGRPVEPEPLPEPAEVSGPPPAARAPAPVSEVPPAQAAATPPPPPTLEDVQALTPESDFTRFARPGVAADVKNAAMKKLFADPHFNVMDRLDVYIDDYNTPDPMSPAMLRQLASAKFLKLFDDEEEKKQEKDAAAGGREVADKPAPQSVAQSGTAAPAVVAPPEEHADPDLRLQQDDAPGPRGPGHRD